ncbi:MAG: heme exporter protein CcmD [Pseudomonadota bacterium]
MPEPNFATLAAFIDMDGHGFYVWLSVALALLAIGANWATLRAARRQFLADARARAQGGDALDRAPALEQAAATLLDGPLIEKNLNADSGR